MIEKPLDKFSFYSHLQSEFLIRFSKEIFQSLEKCMEENSEIDCSGFNDIWGKIWLWVLGSYEVVRTMDQYNNCFSSRMHKLIKETKSTLADIRIPMAKQEKRGNKKGIVYEPSVSSINVIKKDFGFQVNGKLIYFRELVYTYQTLIEELKEEDVLCSLDSAREGSS